MNDEGAAEYAMQLWRDYGPDGCRAIRDALTRRLAAARMEERQRRAADGVSRPRRNRNITSAAKTAKLMEVSEASVTRSKFVQRHAPHLYAQLTAGEISIWKAYCQAKALQS